MTHPTIPAGVAARDADRKLDAALEDSFPASDPPAVVRNTPAPSPTVPTAAEAERKARQSSQLDAALDDTFPASDPPALVQP